MLEYVKADAVIKAVKPEAAKVLSLADNAKVRDGKPAVTVRDAILALPVMDERTVCQRLGGSMLRAAELLEELRAEGVLKTKNERLAELAPKEI